MPFKWARDPKVETNLRALGIQFEVETIKLEDVDFQEGLKRQARLLGKLNDDYVLQLGVAMEAPTAAFPMGILQKPPHNAKLWPWSGNHRFAAFAAVFPEATTIEAYTVCVKDIMLLDMLPRVVNAWESGIGFSKEEKMINARWAMEKHSMLPEEAAQMFGLKVDWLMRDRRIEGIRKQLGDLGPKANGIAPSTIIKMGPLSGNANVLKSTAQFLCRNSIKGDEAIQVIEDVKRGKTEAQQMAEIARWEQVIDERKPKPKTKKTPAVRFSKITRDQFLKHLAGVAKILEKADTLEKLQCTDAADKDLVIRHWLAIVKVMAKVEKGVA